MDLTNGIRREWEWFATMWEACWVLAMKVIAFRTKDCMVIGWKIIHYPQGRGNAFGFYRDWEGKTEQPLPIYGSRTPFSFRNGSGMLF